ncbi:MAG: hypothetical protein SP4CHLAM5_09240 [Chlamydiia bacterium]|nr:hypothetical protein [Chlamydiia bacterium]MCH9618784.1 hypothetical protein [Chlamydiia bacterium]MCH9624351.1 hypothetical protein [Chlamydiia bacterium]
MRCAENIKAFKESPSSYDCINITIDGSPSSDLCFKSLSEQIEEVLTLNVNICIELFLDLLTDEFSFANPLEFAIRKRALEVALEHMENIPKDKISHIIFYRGSIDFSNQIKRNLQTNEEYELWKSDLVEYKVDEEHLLHLYSATLLSNFFHSLGSILPDHIKGTLLFTLPKFLEFAKTAELLSEETFSHLEIGIKNPKYFIEGISWGEGAAFHHLSYLPIKNTISEDDVKTAVILPFLGLCDYKKFEEICTLLTAQNIPFKIIEENLMNEKWFDIDHILFDHEALSFDGKRMVDGFIAAGGKGYTFTSSGTHYRENVTAEEGFLDLEAFKETL